METSNVVVGAKFLDRVLQSSVEYFVLSYEILLSDPESEEQIEATVEVREGFNEDAETFAHANMDTLQLDPEPDDLDLKAAVTAKIKELLEAEGYEILNLAPRAS